MIEMTTYVDSKQILINSKYADEYKNGTMLSNLYFSFPSLLTNDNDILYKQISISNCQIPVSFYVINKYNNTLIYVINDTIITKTFTQGNYNASTFITEFKSIMGTGWDITINRQTGKFTFIYTSSFSFLVESTIFTILGLSNETHTSIGTTLIANYLSDFSNIRCISVRSSILSLTNRDSKTSSYSQDVQIIPVNQPAYGIIKFENVSNFKSILSNQYLDGFDIQLMDDSGQFIDMNNINWSMTIQLDIIRYQGNFNNSITTQMNTIINLLNALNPQPVEAQQDNQDNIQEEQIQENIIPDGDNSLDLLLYQNQFNQ